MGLHVGDTEVRDGDYFGRVMNRAARVMAAGHGGQVLATAAVLAETEGRLPAGAGFRELGTHRLKDLTEPERIYS
ncbi:MAG: hypothetical protein L0Z49_03855 [Actinobacteria bacterium]|nr:hypothetical protein [Actinomycetota bacterium]